MATSLPGTTWSEPRPGYVIRDDGRIGHEGRFTVFRRQHGLWELFDARYPTYGQACDRADRDADREARL